MTNVYFHFLFQVRLDLKNKKRQLRRKKKKERNAKATNPVKPSRPDISTSRWLHLWTEGDTQRQTMLNDFHVTRNSVRFMQEMVHCDQ